MSRALGSLVLVASAIVVGGCRADSATAPDARVVSVTTTSCGDTSKTSASGVVIEEGRVLTVAHAVIGAGTVSITGTTGDTAPAAIVRLDPTRDLAVLAIDGLAGSPVRFATLTAGDRTVIASARSGELMADVTRRATLEIDEVRGTARHRRSGYELAAPVAVGDSGAGVFDDDRLAGGSGEWIENHQFWDLADDTSANEFWDGHDDEQADDDDQAEVAEATHLRAVDF